MSTDTSTSSGLLLRCLDRFRKRTSRLGEQRSNLSVLIDDRSDFQRKLAYFIVYQITFLRPLSQYLRKNRLDVSPKDFEDLYNISVDQGEVFELSVHYLSSFPLRKYCVDRVHGSYK